MYFFFYVFVNISFDTKNFTLVTWKKDAIWVSVRLVHLTDGKLEFNVFTISCEFNGLNERKVCFNTNIMIFSSVCCLYSRCIITIMDVIIKYTGIWPDSCHGMNQAFFFENQGLFTFFCPVWSCLGICPMNF